MNEETLTEALRAIMAQRVPGPPEIAISRRMYEAIRWHVRPRPVAAIMETMRHNGRLYA